MVTVARTVEFDHADPAFAGHYPGFPVLPGVQLIETVHAMVTAARRAELTFPVAVERAKFHQPVRPGTVLRVEAALSYDGTSIVAVATVSAKSGPVAEIRMRYATCATGSERSSA
jgi:3-hydroxyacyl-[acyl-carrier-protein] dehydratase